MRGGLGVVRFHLVSEFEESKRSCKRRLAGHNERRRKSSHDSMARNSSHHGMPYYVFSSRYCVLSVAFLFEFKLLAISVINIFNEW